VRFRHAHKYEVVLPRDEYQHIELVVGSCIKFSNHGDPEPFCVVELIAKDRTRITFRDDDERFTQADLELLQHMELKPGVVI